MKGINIGRWLLGGLAAGALIWAVEGISSMATMHYMEEALESHNLKMDVSPAIFAISIMASMILGLVLIFFYAASRSRFGSGPKTAVIVAVALWFGAHVTSIIGYYMLGLFPVNLLFHFGIVGLLELIAAALLGGWIYRET